MMRSLVALCVRHYGAITALTLMALVLGSWGAMQAPLDVFPEFVPSQVDIQTEAPGFAPQQVEELVTRQVENAVNGSAGIATMRSESIPGLSVVTITFADGDRCARCAPGYFGATVGARECTSRRRGLAQIVAARLEHDGSAEDRVGV